MNSDVVRMTAEEYEAIKSEPDNTSTHMTEQLILEVETLRAELARKDERIAELEGELRSCCVRVDEFKAYISSTANGTARITEKLRDSGFKSPWIEVAIDNVLSELAAARQEIARLKGEG